MDKQYGPFFNKSVLTHSLFWILYILYELSLLLVISPDSVVIKEIIIWFCLNIGLFYTFSEYVLMTYRTIENLSKILIYAGVLIMIYLGICLLITCLLIPFTENKAMVPFADVYNKYYIAQRIWRATWFIALATGYWFAKKSIKIEKEKTQLTEKNLLQKIHEKELEKKIAVSQLSFYKAQINPHFLFNTLNFFHSTIYPISKDVAKSILILSDMMRYNMANNDTDGQNEIAEEIKYIENFLLMNQLRFNNDLCVVFEYTGIPNHKKIPPFILMTLIENAFKYGDLKDCEDPLTIRLNIYHNLVRMKIRNKINASCVFEKHGIGLNNLRKRLDLCLKDRYKLTTQISKKHYLCSLEMEIDEC